MALVAAAPLAGRLGLAGAKALGVDEKTAKMAFRLGKKALPHVKMFARAMRGKDKKKSVKRHLADQARKAAGRPELPAQFRDRVFTDEEKATFKTSPLVKQAMEIDDEMRDEGDQKKLWEVLEKLNEKPRGPEFSAVARMIRNDHITASDVGADPARFGELVG
jgi:hypothetical protein